MKKIGKILEFDNYNGIIVDADENNYIFSAEEIKTGNDLKCGDYVSFIVEIYETVELRQNIARFISKVNKKEDDKKDF